MRSVLLIAVGLLAAICQTALARHWTVGRVTPDLLCLVACLGIMAAPTRWSWLWAAALGLAVDLLSPGRLGASLAGFALAGAALAAWQRRLRLEQPLARALLTGGATLLAGFCTCLADALTSGRLNGVTLVPAISLYTAGVAWPAFMLEALIAEALRGGKTNLAET